VKQFRVDVGTVRARFAEVEERVAAAAARASRDPSDVAVLVATKYVAPEDMGLLRAAGIRLVGENRAQDLVEKHALYGDDFDFHFIGHLQSRKAKLVLPLVSLIHSVSTMSVVRDIDARTAVPVDVLLEVNIGGEATKSGVMTPQVEPFLDAASSFRNVRFVGLMCMPPLGGRPEDARRYFSHARGLAARLSAEWSGTYTFEKLSMGTSADYEIAVEEGATIVRVGSVLF
jgi:hypothetical protein